MKENQNNERKSAHQLNQLIRQLADKENEEREEVTKKYVTQDEKEAQEYERGFRDGWQAAKDKFWAEGFDEGLKQAAKEQKDKEESK